MADAGSGNGPQPSPLSSAENSQNASGAVGAPVIKPTGNAYYSTESTRIKFNKNDVLQTKDASELFADAASKGFNIQTGSSGSLATSANSQFARDGARWMDDKRRRLAAYDFLCQIASAKRWIEQCIGTELPPETELAKYLQNGVALAYLSRHFEPEVVKKIFEDPKLQFRHSDNIVFFFNLCIKVGLPTGFLFETNDLYALKNFPKVIYTIHAISHLLAKQGRGPRIANLVGKIQFSDADVDAMHATIEKQGITLPSFNNLGTSLAKAMGEVMPEENVVVCQKAVRLFLNKRRLEKFTAQVATENPSEVLTAQRAVRVFLEKRRLERFTAEIEVVSLKEVSTAQRAIRVHLQKRRLERFTAKIEKEHPEKVIVAQRAIRQHMHQKKLASFAAYIEENHMGELFVAQRVCRHFLVQKREREMLQHYKDGEQSVIKVQSAIRMVVLRKKYEQMLADHRMLENEEQLTMPDLSRVVHMFAFREEDDSLGLEIENLHAEVVNQIRNINVLEAQLSKKDQTIELLVKNKLTLNDWVKETNSNKKGKDGRRGSGLSPQDEERAKATLIFRGRSTNKAVRQLVDAYQGLMYILQTQPIYLSRLLTALAGANEKFIQKCHDVFVLTLFSYAQNPREEFLLLKVFESVIENEITAICEISQNISTFLIDGAPALFTLLRNFARSPRQRKFLRDVFGTHVEEILKVNNILEVDPVAIHKQLIKEEESSTGVKSSRKYDVTHQEALALPEVSQRLQKNTFELFKFVKKVLISITGSIKAFPYGIRYIARYLRIILTRKFPTATTDEISRCVAHLVFSRYMNPAIVSPELFDVTTETVSPAARKNLSELSRILSFICADAQRPVHLSDDLLPSWVHMSREDFGLFLNEITNVADPGMHLHYDVYADAASRKPYTIFISPNEILFAHETVVKYRAQVCLNKTEDVSAAAEPESPTANDNTSPVADDSMKKSPLEKGGKGEANDKQRSRLQKVDLLAKVLDHIGKVPNYDREHTEPEIMFTISPKLLLASEDSTQKHEHDLRRLYAFAKHEIVRIIRIHGNCDSIPEMLKIIPTKRDEEQFASYDMLLPGLLGTSNKQAPASLIQQQNASKLLSTDSIALNESTEALNENGLVVSTENINDVTLSNGNISAGASALSPPLQSANNANGDNNGCLRVNPITEILYEPPAQTILDCQKVIQRALDILVEHGTINPESGYATVMRSIASDFRRRHKRAEQRRAQKESLIATLKTLAAKEKFLHEQEKSYNEYIEECLQRLSINPETGARRKGTWLPFGRSARVSREIEKRRGHKPKLGSFGYTLRELQDKGLVLSVGSDKLTGRVAEKVNVTVSSDKQGVFDMYASFKAAGLEEFREDEVLNLDELLNMDFDGVRECPLFDEMIVFNVQLLIGTINKKFYA